jgi:class 3 adenylate cyclase/tetratricopeptide (TPR) repeat protein
MAVSRRERKVVTVVFCDLVGFTARAESMDPEDVEALLGPYHERVRSELERHGGTVEKFIGDAVMALFGAPTAHEDDPERAVRAALAIRDFALEEELELRVGITTGEALVRLDAQPGAGEGMASGDVVNTAARLQSAAPVNGILVDETTYRATRAAIDYEGAAAVEAKGKVEPVPVWTATAAHSRFGVDVAHEARSGLVGRERELGIVSDAFERARHERTPQLLTLVGVPGIGKSRLVYELFTQVIVPDPDLITWRQGRCLAYGDGITLWALGEIVKAQAGVLEQDSPADISEKIHDVVVETLAGTGDETRVESHLLGLLGLAGETQLGGDRRNESFSAWRRFLEGLAEQRPLVIVVEDIHWADESLLDFLDELVDWSTDVPLLVVATARPELLERRPGWGGGKLNATTLALSPLSDDQTAELLGKLLGSPVLDAGSQQALLERAGGNPLYAEQFVELYVEQGSTEELALPETLQGIIAARLDGLPESEKGLLQDAAVVGKVFWASSIGRGPEAATTSLHSLERKGFVRRQRRSSLEGESEYAFAHALVRDVAYGQIARADRAAKHRRTAEWIAGLGRPEDHAEMLAYHWTSALELVRASGRDDAELAEHTRLALVEAGDRAFGLNAFGAAVAYYTEALALWPVDAAGRAALLFRKGHALHVLGDDAQGAALEEARDALLEIGDEETAGQAEAFLSRAAWYRGHGEEARRHIERAQELVADAGPTPPKARVLCLLARLRMLSSEPEEAIEIGTEALRLAETLDLDEFRIHALTTIGSAKTFLSNTGDAELERALELAKAVNSPLGAVVLNNLSVLASRRADLDRAQELLLETLDLALQFGDRENVRFTRANLLYHSSRLGRWDELLEEADRFIAECETSPHNMETAVRELRGNVRFARGDVEAALADWERGIALAREMESPERLLPGLLQLARGLMLLGRQDEARVLVAEGMGIAEANPSIANLLGIVADQATALGVVHEIVEIIELAPGGPWKDAALADARGEHSRAADMYERMGFMSIAADVRFGAAEALLEEGLTAEGLAELDKALAFFRPVGATFFLERGEALVADAQRDSA